MVREAPPVSCGLCMVVGVFWFLAPLADDETLLVHVIAAVFEGTGAVDTVRKTVGATNPANADAGTIRGDLGLETGRNLIHASDSLESAKREVPLFFEDSQVVSHKRDIDRWIFEEP